MAMRTRIHGTNHHDKPSAIPATASAIRMSHLVIVAILALMAVPVSAQTYSAASKVSFEAPANSGSVPVATGLNYLLRIDGGTPLTLAAVACTQGAVIQCSAALPAAAVPFLNALGGHVATLSAVEKTAGEGPQSSPFASAPVKPAAPMGLSITP